MTSRFKSIHRIIFLFALFCAVGAMTACGSGQELTANPSSKTVVTVWSKDRHDSAYQIARVKAYNETNSDNILVEYRIFSDNYLQSLDSAFQTGRAPDLMAYTDQVFYRFYAQDRFADLTPYMDGAFHDLFDAVLLDGVNVLDGACYFVPTCATTPRLFYNQAILDRVGIESPPKTMEELIADCRTITSQLGEEGIYGFAANFYSASSALERSLLAQGNLQLGLKAGYDFQNACYDFAPYARLLVQWRTLLSPDCAYPRCDQLDIDPLRQMFSSGKIGMYISYIHSEAGVYQNQFEMTDEWGCAPLPTSDARIVGAQNYSLNGGYLLNRDCRNPDAAWKVYRALFADEKALTEYYEAGYGVSIVPKVLANGASDGYTPAHAALVLGEADQLWPLAPQEENPAAVELDGADLYAVFKELIFSTQPIDPALDALTERYNHAYRLGIEAGVGRMIRRPGFDPFHPRSAPEVLP